MFAVKLVAGSKLPTILWRMTDFNRFVVGIDQPSDLRFARKEVFQPLVYLLPGVVWRQDFHREIRRAGEKRSRANPRRFEDST